MLALDEILLLDVRVNAPAIAGYTALHDRREAARPVLTTDAGEGEYTLSDEALAEGIGRCDVGALEALYERHGRVVFSLAVKMLGDRQAAEEIVQETFVKLWQRPETYVPSRGRLLPWLMGVAHHRAVDRLRRRRLELRYNTDPTAFDPPADPGDPFDEVLAGLRGAAVGRALRTLPEAQRRAVELAYLRGLTHVEIADVLGEPLGTIKTRLRLAMQKLRASVELADLRPEP